MSRLSTSTLSRLAVAALFTCAAAASFAQVPGVYTGITSQGLEMSITLADDGSGGLVYAGNSFQVNTHCTSGDSHFSWWGVGGSTPITGYPFTTTFAGDSLYETLKFTSDGTTLTGGFVESVPVFVDINTSKRVERCDSGKVTFTATLSGAQAAARPQTGGAPRAFVIER